jgi:hypothetical protein
MVPSGFDGGVLLRGNIYLDSCPEPNVFLFFLYLPLLFCLYNCEQSKCYIMSPYRLAAAAALLFTGERAVDNGLVITPQMGCECSFQEAYEEGI